MKLQPPVQNMDELWSANEKAIVHSHLDNTIIGTKEEVKTKIEMLLKQIDIDEIIIVSTIYDSEARKHSYELISEALID